MRSDLSELRAGEEELSELRLLLRRRRDLVTDQSRTITRLREALVSLFPALERMLDLNGKGPLTPSSATTRVQHSLDERAISVLLLILETAASRGSIA